MSRAAGASARPLDGQAVIERLPDVVAAQIAAGEVIERPAAVLKELIENSLDAGATRISIEVEDAGRERIAVHDDGCGIPTEQLTLAFARHATSKLRTARQLFSLTSYGFRGEALPAIAAAAGTLTFTTRTNDSPAAAQITFRDGREEDVRAAARAPGSSVELLDLFANQPARKAFLAGPRAERAALVRVASDAVLANPSVSIRLQIDGREVLNHQAAEAQSQDITEQRYTDLRYALASVFGPGPAQRAVVFAATDEDGLSLDGFAGATQDARRNRDGIRLFVNGRPVHDRRLSYAVQEAYRDWLPSGRFPLAIVRLHAPPDRVDVNVHPAKTEVKLRDADRAFGLVQRTLRETLAQDRSAAPVRLASSQGQRPDLEYAEELRPFRPIQPGLAGSPRSAIPDTSTAAKPVESTWPGRLPPLRMVGQLHRTFIIAEGPNGLVLIDQHGAHERVVYERLLAASDDHAGAVRQPLLDPPVITLDANEAATWSGANESLARLGFEIDLFGDRAVRLRALPAALPSVADGERLLRGILADLSAIDRPPDRFDPVAASAACHGSVRRGAALDAAAMGSLLRDLERCRNPHSCPHGRPTLVEIAADDLLREFGRT